MADPKASDIVRKFEQAQTDRRNWESLWQDVADLVRPTVRFQGPNVPGSRRRRRVYDDTATKVANRSAAAMYSMTVNPAIKWVSLATNIARINERRENRLWLKYATDHILTVFASARSGFASMAHEVFFDLVTFNTAVCMGPIEKEGRLRFMSRPLSETYLIDDVDGEIVGVFRKFYMKAHEIWAKRDTWEMSTKMYERVRGSKDNADKMNDDVCVLHYVYKRDHRDPTLSDGPNKPWGSIYVEHDAKFTMNVAGFDRNPYKTPRWSKESGETYGRGPGIDSSPSTKGMNVMKKTVLEAGEKAVHPPLQVPANGIEGPIHTSPNSLIYYRMGGAGGRTGPIYPVPTGDPRLGEEMLESERNNIVEMFYLDLIQLPNLDRMTATEVLERIQQKLGIMAPFLSRVAGEFLSPIVEDTVTMEIKAGRLEPPPQDILDAGLVIEYSGPLAIAQRGSEATNVQRLLQAVAPFGPEAMHTFDADATIRKLSYYYNTDPDVLKSPEDAQSSREQQNAMAQAVQGAGAAKDIGSAVKDAASAGQV